MALKRKTRKASKVVSAEKKFQEPRPESSVEELIKQNGELVENLFSSEVWNNVIVPLFEESIASVSGRKTNGRYFHGTLTRDWSKDTSLFLAGYQKALMDLWNNLNDFVVAKYKLKNKVSEAKLESTSPIINPFTEED